MIACLRTIIALYFESETVPRGLEKYFTGLHDSLSNKKIHVLAKEPAIDIDFLTLIELNRWLILPYIVNKALKRSRLKTQD